jgi:hypothetical protein
LGYTVVNEPIDSPNATLIKEFPSITLHQITQKYGSDIGVLKFDIEGGEHNIFSEGAPGLARIPVIFAELHDRIAFGCTSLFEDFSRDRHVDRFGGEKHISVSRDLSLKHETENVL